MKSYRMIAIAFVVVLAGLLLAPGARADEWNKKTKVTINVPLQVPGMVLEPGTYTFTMLSLSGSRRNIVQIWNADRTHLFADISTVPVDRTRSAGHPVLELKQVAKNSPPELLAWFYPGDKKGQEFVYPKAHAATTAKVGNKGI